MKEIILTGYSKKEVLKILKKKEKAGCYICKRKIGDEGIFIVEEDVGERELEFEWVEVIRDDIKFRFPICHECQLLMEGIAEKIEFARRTFIANQN